MCKLLSLLLLLLALPAQADFTPETCLELSRGYWLVYESNGEANAYLTKRLEDNCSNNETDELIFTDDHIQDIIKRLQLKGILATN
jgi:hypothetical protein